MSWRVGTHYGVHVYDTEYDEIDDTEERPVATFFRASDAEAAVAAYNDRGNSELIAELRQTIHALDRQHTTALRARDAAVAEHRQAAEQINRLQTQVNNQHAKIKALSADGRLRGVLRGQQEEIRRADRILQAAGITVAITTEPFDDTPTKETDVQPG